MSCSSWAPSVYTVLWLKWWQQFPFFSIFWTKRRRNRGTGKQGKLPVRRRDRGNSCPSQPIFSIAFKICSFYVACWLQLLTDCWKEPMCYSRHFWQICRKAIQLRSAANPQQTLISSQKLNPTETKHLPSLGTLEWRQRSWASGVAPELFFFFWLLPDGKTRMCTRSVV